MNDEFRKSASPTDGMAPGPLTPPRPSVPNALELARLLDATSVADGLEGLKPFDFRAAPGSPLDGSNVTPIRPVIPDDLDRAFREFPAGEMDLFGADARPTGTREDDKGAAVDVRRPARWRTIAGTFALASVLLILSPFVTSFPYRRLAAAILEPSLETVAQAASNVRDAIPALTQSLQARWPSARQAYLSNVEWLTAWLEPTSAPSQASALAAPAAHAVTPTTAARTDQGHDGQWGRLELASADLSFLERPDALRIHPATLVLPSIPDLAIASGTGSDIILSAGPEALESPQAKVAPDATAPANAEVTPKVPASSDAAAVTETRPLPAAPSAAPALAPINPADIDALLDKLAPVPSPGASDQPADAAALPAPRFDVPGSPDPGAELVEALAKERKEALDRERERADALVRELAGLRDAIDAMKSRTAPTVMDAPALPLVPVPPTPSGRMQPPAPKPVAAPMPVPAPTPDPVRVVPLPPPTEQVAPTVMNAPALPLAPVPPAPSEPMQAPAPKPVAAPIPVAAPTPDPVRVVPPPPPTEQVRLDPPQPVAPPPPVSRLPDNAAPAPRPPAPQAVVQAPATPSTAPNEQRLIERAEALLKLYDISGARLILDRAMTAGSARAAYLLAQTYDPRVLDEWRVVGIKGDPAKAEELYARAQAGGIREAGQRRP